MIQQEALFTHEDAKSYTLDIFGKMRILLVLVLILTASAKPAVQDGNSPLVKEDVVSVVQEEPIEQQAKAEQGPLMQDEPVADSGVMEPDSVVLELEATEEWTEPQKESEMLEEPVLEADYLMEKSPETGLEPESEMSEVILTKQNSLEEESLMELESESLTEVASEEVNLRMEEPTLEADYIVVDEPVVELEPGRVRRTIVQKGKRQCRGVVLQGKCYEFLREPKNANSAEVYCKTIYRNGQLASVTSSFIHQQMMRLMDQNGGRTRTWIGGRRYLNTRRFQWLDGAPWRYVDWLPGEPNNSAGIENCVELLSNGQFNDMPCHDLRAYICSYPVY
ncbi:proteoglycan 3 [Xyrauchen texanus]|uniref:proteoglycan 3 n=1 Tax=Xyrauchen texanus TaxID=154827 RepID=UPI00224263E1|nr:proteoglycan 3 [Xyrauchen texanus]